MSSMSHHSVVSFPPSNYFVQLYLQQPLFPVKSFCAFNTEFSNTEIHAGTSFPDQFNLYLSNKFGSMYYQSLLNVSRQLATIYVTTLLLSVSIMWQHTLIWVYWDSCVFTSVLVGGDLIQLWQLLKKGLVLIRP